MMFHKLAATALGLLGGNFVASSAEPAQLRASARNENDASSDSRLGWRSDLRWSNLSSQLSEPSSLVAVSASTYVEECVPEFERLWDLFGGDRSQWGLIDTPSGLCMHNLLSTFKDHYPKPDHQEESIIDAQIELAGHIAEADPFSQYRYLIAGTYSTLPEKIRSWIELHDNDSSELPGRVLHPRTASDVIYAINFAKEHGLEISVKNSGHNFAGASTKADTLLLNMRRYVRYASGGITDCSTAGEYAEYGDDLSGQPCRLSIAKGKPGVIRVGGGENFSELYVAVHEANMAIDPDNFKYHVVGGAAGTVSPHGWTYQGGLPGTTMGRTLGFGVDQVVQLEMVLANGMHVKFGPTSWEDAEGYLVPKTTAVTGVCRSNPDELDESNWIWEACPEEIPFDDLWFAIRGGGGGWGVVLSITLQLHDYPGKRNIIKIPAEGDPTFCNEGLGESGITALHMAKDDYQLKFVLDPASLGIDVDSSYGCANPDNPNMECSGQAAADSYTDGWKNYVQSTMDGVLDDEQIEAAANCYSVELSVDKTDQISTAGRFPGTITSFPYPWTMPPSTEYNLIIPRKALLDNPDLVHLIGSFTVLPISNHYKAFAGYNMKETSDQANSLSEAHRTGGVMWFGVDPSDDFFTNIFPLMYDTSDPDNFPGFLGSNHPWEHLKGPLKDDWTKGCPDEWSPNERDEKCISVQEAIYGTKHLRRLEAIKASVDPDNMFNCRNCIGYVKCKNAISKTSKRSKTTSKSSKTSKSGRSSSSESQRDGVVSSELSRAVGQEVAALKDDMEEGLVEFAVVA